MQMRNTPLEKKCRYRLLSFAPSSGIGFYEFKETIHQFDLVTGEDIVMEKESFLAAQRFEFGQIESGLDFNCFQDLLSLAKEEYLRDQKMTYYTALFTQPLSDEMRDETLKILNEEGFREIQLPKKFVSVLKEITIPKQVPSTRRRAMDLDLTNVVNCLNSELREVVGSLELQIVEFPHVAEDT
jgi:hypothetical protein